MSDGIRGIMIVIAGYAIAVVIGLVKASQKAKRNGGKLKKSTAAFFILGMAFCAAFIIYHFIPYT